MVASSSTTISWKTPFDLPLWANRTGSSSAMPTPGNPAPSFTLLSRVAAAAASILMSIYANVLTRLPSMTNWQVTSPGLGENFALLCERIAGLQTGLRVLSKRSMRVFGAVTKSKTLTNPQNFSYEVSHLRGHGNSSYLPKCTASPCEAESVRFHWAQNEKSGPGSQTRASRRAWGR